MKKFFLLICFFVSLFLFSTPIYAITSKTTDNGIVYYIHDNWCVITDYIGSETELTIPEQIENYKVSQFNTTSKNYTVKSIYFTSTATTIPTDTLKNYKELEYVQMPGVGSNLENVFSDCPNLKSYGPIGSGCNIEYPQVSESAWPYSSNFSSNNTLEKIILPNYVETVVFSAFANCTSLKEVIFPEKVTSFQAEVFFNCTSLEKITLPQNLTWLPTATFKNCSSLKEIICPQNLAGIGQSVFLNCIQLETITLSEKITEIPFKAFKGCTNLKNIEFPKNIKTISSEAFSDCTSLTRITLPENIEQVGSLAFKNCSNLEKVIILNPSLSVFYYPFVNCPKLETAGPIGSDCNIEFAWDTVIPVKAFTSHSSLKYVIIPDGVTTINTEAFNDCQNLLEIYLPSSVTTLYYYSLGAPNLQAIYFDGTFEEWNAINKSSFFFSDSGQMPPVYILRYEFPFVDVNESAYYYNAVEWAHLNSITSGTDSTHFSPNAPCTRGQSVSFLWRVFNCEYIEIKNPFVDVHENNYFYRPVLWAYYYGITAGTDNTHFTPDAMLTRAQFVTFLWRTQGEPKPTIQNTFVDVPNKSYYRDAVLWAYENGITAGTDATHFNPNGLCTRSHVVTFLYRAFGQEVASTI